MQDFLSVGKGEENAHGPGTVVRVHQHHFDASPADLNFILFPKKGFLKSRTHWFERYVCMYVILCSALLLLCTYANNIIQGSENSKYLQLIMAHVNAYIHTFIHTYIMHIHPNI